MKSKDKPKQKRSAQEKPKQAKGLAASAAKDGLAAPPAPAPSIDEIITISRDYGKARLELKKTEDTAVVRDDVKPSQAVVDQTATAEDKPSDSASGQREKKFRLPKKSESKIGTRKPKAAIMKDAPAEKHRKAPETKNIKHTGESEVSASKEKQTREASPQNTIGKTPDPRHIPVSSPKLSESKQALAEAAAQPSPPHSLSQNKVALAEAALFLSPKPMMIDELAKIMGVNSLGYVKETLERLVVDYEKRGIEIVSSPAGWEMQVKPTYLNSVAHLAPYADLSEGPKRALALILFKEPLKQSDLIKMQGNKTYDYLKTLDKLGMVKREPSGRTKILTLTKEFERYFGEEKEAVKQRLGQELANQPQHAEASPVPPKRKIDAKAELNKMGIELDEA
jgi:segregation and condensation protein B